MKLKYLLAAIVATVAVSANADILRLHYTEFDNGTQQEVERTKDYGTNNFFEIVRVLRWNYMSQQYDNPYDYIRFGDEKYPCNLLDEQMSTLSFKSIEFLPAKNVVLDIDAPKSIWIVGYDGRYFLEYSGKVRFADGVDSHEVVNGTVGLSTRGGDINWGNFNLPYILKSKPEAMSSDEEERITMTFENCSENISPLQDDERYFNGINYSIGGDNPDEASFTLRIPALGWFPVLVVLNDENTTCDVFNLGINHVDMAPYRGNYDYSYAICEKELMAGDEIPTDWMWQSELAFSEPATRCGGTAKVVISELLIDDKTVPSEEIADYVIFERPWEFEFNKDAEPVGMRVSDQHFFWNACNVIYNLKKLESVGASSIRVNLKADVDFGSDVPDWLDVMLKTITRDTFYQQLTMYPNRLPIDVSKVSFPDCEQYEGSIAALFDDDESTFCHSSWTKSNERSEPFGSYIDVELNEPIQSVGFSMQARKISNPFPPTKVKMYYSTDGEDWKELGESEFDAYSFYSSKWDKTYAGVPAYFTAPEKFKYIRWCALESRTGSLTQTSASIYWNLAELHFYGK